MSRAYIGLDHDARRVLAASSIVAGLVILIVAAWSVSDVLLLVFNGVLLAIFLRIGVDLLSAHSPLSAGWSLAVVTLALFSLLGLGAWLFGPVIGDGIDALTQSLPDAIKSLQQHIGQYAWGKRLLHNLQPDRLFSVFGHDTLSHLTGIFSSGIGIVVSGVVVIFIGIYVAADPHTYMDAIVRLVPHGQRDRAYQILGEIGYSLRWWLIGRMGVMLANGVFTWAGLWLLGLPHALILSMLVALLSFVPNLGAVVAAVPAVLIGLAQSPMMAVYVVTVYTAVQTLEGYLLTPVIQRRAVGMPPAILLTVQLIMGVLFGALGLLLAVPLALVVFVFIRSLYLQEVLGEPESPSEQDSEAAGR